MIDIDQIQETFIVSEEYPAGIVCLASIMRLYNDDYTCILLTQWKDAVTLADIKKVANALDFDANVQIMTINQLKTSQAPIILLFTNELGKTDFVVYYGFDGRRFIIGEPTFGLIQYTSEEMEQMWIKGIVLMMFPEIVLVNRVLKC